MNKEIQLKLLQQLESNKKISQRDLSTAIGVSLGSVNFMLKALKEKGLIKWENFSNNPNKRQYLYSLTHHGVLEKAKLTYYFLEKKQMEYELLKKEMEKLQVHFVKNEELSQCILSWVND
jgi:EPS-associated MarR family transcriptional regulator